jgi:hypothetical protein
MVSRRANVKTFQWLHSATWTGSCADRVVEIQREIGTDQIVLFFQHCVFVIPILKTPQQFFCLAELLAVSFDIFPPFASQG